MSSRVIQPKTKADEKDIKRDFVFPPYFSPLTINFKWEKDIEGITAVLEGNLIVGLTPKWGDSGVTMYGNGRLFAENIADESVGYGWKHGDIQKQHVTIQRIHSFYFFEASNPAWIPWQAPLKDGYNRRNPFAGEIRDLLNNIIPKYIEFVRDATGNEILPFCAEWKEMSTKDKLSVLFPNSNEDEKKELAKLAEVKSLLKYKYTAQKMEKYKLKYLDFPCPDAPFNIKTAKDIHKLIKHRKKGEIGDIDYWKVMLPNIFKPHENLPYIDEVYLEKVLSEKINKKDYKNVRVSKQKIQELKQRFPSETESVIVEKIIDEFLLE